MHKSLSIGFLFLWKKFVTVGLLGSPCSFKVLVLLLGCLQEFEEHLFLHIILFLILSQFDALQKIASCLNLHFSISEVKCS